MGNAAGGNGGAIFSGWYSEPVITNSIFWNDSPEEIFTDFRPPEISFSDVEGGWPGEGNIDLDPFFVAGDRGDPRLRWRSPCIDRGDPDSTDSDGTRRDMGSSFFDQSRELVLYVSSDRQILHPGESHELRYTICNRYDTPKEAWFIADLFTPDGEPWHGNPLEGHVHLSIEPGSNKSMIRSYDINPASSDGLYSLVCRIGRPSELLDADSFNFFIRGMSKNHPRLPAQQDSCR